MAGQLSVSQAIQASVIIQQQEECNSNNDTKKQKEPVAFWKQLLLTAALFGTESTTAFEQVYTLLCLQYLGVPVTLMSVNGLIAGITALSLIPLVGVLVDRGSNPKKRKMMSLLFGLLILLGGLSMIIAACAIKISQTTLEQGPKLIINTTKNLPNRSDLKPSSLNSPWMLSNNQDPEETIFYGVMLYSITTEITNYDNISAGNTGIIISTSSQVNISNGEAYLPLTGLLGILGFAFTDIGFDLGTPFARAFVLDNTPPAGHSKILVTGTLLASFAGTSMSALGMFDMPRILGETFHVDGMSTTFIMFTCILIVVDICCYGCTIFTGMRIGKSIEKGNEAHQSVKTLICKDVDKASHINDHHTGKIRILRAKDAIKQNANMMVHDINDKTPLLVKTEMRSEAEHQPYTFNYSTITTESVNDSPVTMCSEYEKSTSLAHKSSQNLDDDFFNDPDARNASTHRDMEEKNTTPNGSFCAANNSAGERSFCNIRTELSAFLHTSSHSSPLGEFHNKKLQHLNSKHKFYSKKSRSSFCNQRLALLIAACCFSMSAMITFIMFIPNTLTIAVFKGDPLALPGTEENNQYQLGLRTAASGSLVFYISYFVTCAFNNKIFEVIGEKMHFMVCHLLLLVCLLTFILTERVEVYYVAMAAFGPYRTCVFTLPFILANKYSQDKNESNDTLDQPKKSQVGRVMALIGFVLPCNYTIISSIMGPLIAATSVWTPLIWSCAANFVAMIVFSLLFFV